MHDIDSTRLEANSGYELEEHQESENYEGESYEAESYESEGESSFEMPMSEAEEEALAAELLGVSNELELEQFLGGLFRKLKQNLGGATKFLAQNAGPLAGALKGIAIKALPLAGGALGSAIPVLGTAFGAKLGSLASNLLQSEMENMEAEEQEFEMARRYVRVASQAIRHAGRIPPRPNRSVAANLALRNAFRRFRNNNSGGWQQPSYIRYRRCPPCPLPEPCPACPTCSQPLSGVETPAPESVPTPTNAGPTPSTPQTTELEYGESGEFENEGEGEYESNGEFGANNEFGESEFGNSGESEGEYHETENEAPPIGAPRSGRWVRRGRKVVLYGL